MLDEWEVRLYIIIPSSMEEKNRLLGFDEPIEFEK